MLSSPPHPWSPRAIPSSAKRQSAEGCFMTEQRAMPEWGKRRGGSHRLTDKNMIRSPICLSSEGNMEFHTAKLFLEPNNLCLTKTCSKKLKSDPPRFEDDKMWILWLLVLQTLSEHPWKTSTNQTQSETGEALHSLYCTGHPIWQENLILHFPLQISPAHPTAKAPKNQCSITVPAMTMEQPGVWSCSSEGQWALLPLNSIQAEMPLRFFQFRCQLLIWMMVIWFHGKSVESS